MATAKNSKTYASYFRRDQAAGITAPNLLKRCTFAEHVVRARGKRTAFTSVTLDPTVNSDFGETTYQLKRPLVDNGGHVVVEHIRLMSELTKAARQQEKGERVRALQAIRYARKRKEGLVDWRFDIKSIEEKDIINWASSKVAAFFTKK